MPEQKQLGFGVANSQPYIDDVEKQSKAGVDKSEQHRDRDPNRTPNLLRVANPPTNMCAPQASDRLIELDGTSKLLRSMIGLFLKDAPASMEALVKAAEDGDVEGVREAAHAIRGSAANFGARTLVELTSKIEDQARTGQLPSEGDVVVARKALDHAAAELRHVTGGAHGDGAALSASRERTSRRPPRPQRIRSDPPRR